MIPAGAASRSVCVFAASPEVVLAGFHRRRTAGSSPHCRAPVAAYGNGRPAGTDRPLIWHPGCEVGTASWEGSGAVEHEAGRPLAGDRQARSGDTAPRGRSMCLASPGLRKFISWTPLRAPEIKYILGLQEIVCAGMAEGYARHRQAFSTCHRPRIRRHLCFITPSRRVPGRHRGAEPQPPPCSVIPT